jgi:DNA processing protein
VEGCELWLRLALIPGLSAARLRAVIARLAPVHSAEVTQLRDAGLSSVQCQAFLHPDSRRLMQAERWLADPQHRLLTCHHQDYPAALQSLNDAPPLLFIAGDALLLNAPQCALVGSRRATAYGIHWGDYFAHHLAAIGLVITSGLAVGIDAVCHRATLAAGGKTVTVLGNGLQTPYPRCHQGLAERIIASGGLLVSEYLPDTPPFPGHFPQRNRLISGLSLGVLVIEASTRSGSLITACHALEQGREVFALPGPLDSENSQGCHQLIRQGAWLVSQPSELLELLNSSLHWLPLTLPASPVAVESSEAQLCLDLLDQVDNGTTPIDVIAARAGQPLPDVVKKLIELELAGWITAVPGGYVQRKRTSHVRRLDVPI